MTDPLRSNRPSTPGDPGRDHEAQVEDLLLAGLDHYFAGQHELAINVWTRVLFLDRGHARARAYIERARSAIAERQREGDELLHTGADAFQRGDANAARRLLTSAVERGAGSDEALALLQRLDRLEAATPRAGVPGVKPPAPVPGPREPVAHHERGSHVVWVVSGVITGVLVAAGAGAYLWAHSDRWLRFDGTSSVELAPRAEDPLPVPAASAISIARARTLYDKGRLHEALSALDAVRFEDPAKAEADDLRARIQRDLLAAARGSASSQPESGRR